MQRNAPARKNTWQNVNPTVAKTMTDQILSTQGLLYAASLLFLLLLHPLVAAAPAVGWCCWWCYCKAFFYAGTVNHTLQNDKEQQKNDNARTSIEYWKNDLGVCIFVPTPQSVWSPEKFRSLLFEALLVHLHVSFLVYIGSCNHGLWQAPIKELVRPTDLGWQGTIAESWCSLMCKEGWCRIFVVGSSRLNSSQEHWKIWNLFWERFKSVLDCSSRSRTYHVLKDSWP